MTLENYKETFMEIFEKNYDNSETVHLQILQKILDEFTILTAYDFGAQLNRFQIMITYCQLMIQ